MKAIAIAILLSGIAGPCLAETGAPERANGGDLGKPVHPKATGQDTSAVQPVTYRPPFRGAPTRRIGGSSRSSGLPSVHIAVFAPDDIGLTMSSQPTFYWHASKAIDLPVEFTLVDPNSTKPLVRTTIKSPALAGAHNVSLSDYGVRLEPGIDYEWAIAVISDAKQRSQDIVSAGSIRRIAPTERLRKRLTDVVDDDHFYIYAEEGLWYDAVASLSGTIAKKPSNQALTRQLASLLRQVGLSEHVPLEGTR